MNHSKATIQVKLDRETKKQVLRLFDDLNISLDTAVSMFLSRSLELRAIPEADGVRMLDLGEREAFLNAPLPMPPKRITFDIHKNSF